MKKGLNNEEHTKREQVMTDLLLEEIDRDSQRTIGAVLNRNKSKIIDMFSPNMLICVVLCVLIKQVRRHIATVKKKNQPDRNDALDAIVIMLENVLDYAKEDGPGVDRDRLDILFDLMDPSTRPC